jgi:CDP-diacylglycerol--glycerol-3-phosphate 3-phosphatidyltransferase
MWWLAVTGQARTLGILVGFCLFTDFLDGFVARRTGTATHFGAALDASADNLLLVSSPVWLHWLEPSIWRDHPVWVCVYLAALAAVFGVMAVKFRRNVELHTYAAKLGIVIYWFFVIHTLFFGYHEAFFYLTMLTSYYFLGEDLYLLLSRDELDENVHSFLSP